MNQGCLILKLEMSRRACGIPLRKRSLSLPYFRLSVSLFLIFIFISLFVSYIFMILSGVNSDYQIRKLEKELVSLGAKNNQLEIQLARSYSMLDLEEFSRALGLVNIKQVSYIKLNQPILAATK